MMQGDDFEEFNMDLLRALHLALDEQPDAVDQRQ